MPTVDQDEVPSPGQFRAARALLGFTIVEVSRRARVSVAAVAMVEKDGTGNKGNKGNKGSKAGSPRDDRRGEAIRAAYEAAGVQFLGAAGSGRGLILGPEPAASERGPWSSLR